MSADNKAFLENCSVVGYHGTSSEAAASILKQNFSPSRGEDHWLGAGVYFFETGISEGKEDARKWAKVSAWDNETKRNTYAIYAVVRAVLNFRKLWDLSSQDGLQLFEHVRTQFAKRGVQPGQPTSGRKFDNAVIEFAATKLMFDGIRAWFYIKLDPESRKMRVQSGIQNVTVVCVRDPSASISLDQIANVADGYVVR